MWAYVGPGPHPFRHNKNTEQSKESIKNNEVNAMKWNERSAPSEWNEQYLFELVEP